MTLPHPNPPAAFRKQVFTLLGEIHGDKTLVLCPTAFVRLLHGDHKAAILLSQILYWGDKTKDPEGWFYKSMADWHKETGLSEAQVRRIVNGDPRVKSAQITLRDLGVETLLRKVRRTGAPTLHYRINRERFLAALDTMLEQGDTSQCAESTPDIPQDQPSPESGMNTDQCAASSDVPETSSQEISAADHDPSNPTLHPDDDSDLGLYLSFESRFGKVKSQVKAVLRSELARLGVTKVREVLERCATRGRSWSYVAKALANEAAPALSTTVYGIHNGNFPPLERTDEAEYTHAPQDALLPVSDRLQMPWQNGWKVDSIVADAWSAAFHQLEAQLDSVSFQTYLRDAVLVDYIATTRTFLVTVRTVYARDMLQQRLYRTIRRILVDIYQQPAEVQFLLREEWAGQGVQIA